jgi:DNA-binding transcriptional regulator YiaG
MKMKMRECNYRDCGLDNVIVKNVDFMVDDKGNSVYEIPNVMGLHLAISIAILQQARALRPKEIRYLRTECAWTQSELASRFDRDAQSIGRWERGEVPVDQSCDVLLRLLFAEELKIDLKATVSDMLRDCGPIMEMDFLEIDGSDPSNYEPLFNGNSIAA